MSKAQMGHKGTFTGKHFTPESKRKIRLAILNRISKCRGKVSPQYNPKSIPFFNQINQMFNLEGKHAENGGEFHIKELGYFLDF